MKLFIYELEELARNFTLLNGNQVCYLKCDLDEKLKEGELIFLQFLIQRGAGLSEQ